MQEYLEPTPVVDWENPAVRALARELAGGEADPVAVARRCFEWVRDEIPHTFDHPREPVTCAASDVLREGTGICFAKSHLLAALLRANGIPAGFGYQRLKGAGASYRLHGFNAALLPEIGWYRFDPRGNREGVSTAFDPPREHLAYPADGEGEATFEEIWAEPLPVVLESLGAAESRAWLLEHMPDLDPEAPGWPESPLRRGS